MTINCLLELQYYFVTLGEQCVFFVSFAFFPPFSSVLSIVLLVILSHSTHLMSICDAYIVEADLLSAIVLTPMGWD